MQPTKTDLPDGPVLGEIAGWSDSIPLLPQVHGPLGWDQGYNWRFDSLTKRETAKFLARVMANPD